MSGSATQRLLFYSSAVHECSYLPDEAARSVFVDPKASLSPGLYATLLRHGFRRSGEHVYRPHCENCSACIPVRVPVGEFVPSRSQRRCERSNEDLTVTVTGARCEQEHFDLYRRYLSTRHRGGGMDQPTPESFRGFLCCEWGRCEFVEFRLTGELVAVAVCDVVPDGLSAVYTFFNPELARRGLGTYAILWQLNEARRRRLPFLYLGYWIADSTKMAYKADFLPQQRFNGGRWTVTRRAAAGRVTSASGAM